MQRLFQLRLRDLAGAFSYFSTLPTGRAASLGAPTGGMLALLPLVGAVTGAIAGSLAASAGWAAGERFAPACAILAGVVLTGAIHLDGFLDSCDALFASVTPKRRLEILKDPRHGSFALAGLLCLSVLWITSLSLIPSVRLPALLAWIASTARWASVMNAYHFNYASGGSSGTNFDIRPAPAVMGFTGLVLCGVGILFLGHPWFGCWPLVAEAVALLLGYAAGRRLGGGLVGDVYGAIICVLEVAGVTVVSLYH